MDWVDDATIESEELEPIWMERALEVLGENSEKREELMKELKGLIKNEEDMKVPESEKFYLKFLRSGLMSPSAGLEVMRNYFMLKKNQARYFQVKTWCLSSKTCKRNISEFHRIGEAGQHGF